MADVKIVVGAQDNASRVLADVRGNLSELERSAAALGTALGFIGVAGVAGLATLARNAINGVDALNDLSDATGASVENISALEDVAIRTGTSFETVGSALVKFNAQLKDAKPGSGAEQAITALGLSVKELKALDPAEALLKTSIALEGFADDGNKARLVQELFGKSIKEVAPLLKDLAEKGKLVGTVTTDQAKAAEAFNKQVFELQKNVSDAARALASDLLPIVSEIVKEFTALNAAQSGVSLSGGLLRTAFEATAVTGANVLFVLKGVGREIGAIAAQGAALARGDFTGFKAISEAVKADGVAARAELDLLEKRIFGTVAKVQSLPSRPGQTDQPALPTITSKQPRGSGGVKPAKEVDDTNRALTSYIDNLQRINDKTQELTELEKAQAFLENKGSGANASQREFLLLIAAQVDKEKELTQVLKQKRDASIADGDAVNAQNDAYQARLKALLDATPTAVFEKQQADIRQLVDEFEAGRISEQQYVEAITARLNLTNQKVEETKDLAKELGLSFTSAFEDAVVGGKGLSEVLRGLEQDIIRIVTRKLVTEPLGNAITGALGGLGGSSSGGIGGFISGLFRAEGGPVSAGQPYIVGERGPEMIIPRGNGTVIPNNALGGKTISFNLVQNFAPGTTRATTTQAAADARRQLEMGARNL